MNDMAKVTTGVFAWPLTLLALMVVAVALLGV
jgi:hypothetical protein